MCRCHTIQRLFCWCYTQTAFVSLHFSPVKEHACTITAQLNKTLLSEAIVHYWIRLVPFIILFIMFICLSTLDRVNFKWGISMGTPSWKYREHNFKMPLPHNRKYRRVEKCMYITTTYMLLPYPINSICTAHVSKTNSHCEYNNKPIIRPTMQQHQVKHTLTKSSHENQIHQADHECTPTM